MCSSPGASLVAGGAEAPRGCRARAPRGRRRGAGRGRRCGAVRWGAQPRLGREGLCRRPSAGRVAQERQAGRRRLERGREASGAGACRVSGRSGRPTAWRPRAAPRRQAQWEQGRAGAAAGGRQGRRRRSARAGKSRQEAPRAAAMAAPAPARLSLPGSEVASRAGWSQPVLGGKGLHHAEVSEEGQPQRGGWVDACGDGRTCSLPRGGRPALPREPEERFPRERLALDSVLLLCLPPSGALVREGLKPHG